MAVWECPGCHRRVPDRIAVCHCGMRREESAPAPSMPDRVAVREVAPVRLRTVAPRNENRDDRAPGAARTVVRESWPYLVLFTLALSGAAAWGVRWQPERLPPLLGRQTARPSPSPSPAPSAKPR